MKVYLKIISDPERFRLIGNDWDLLVGECSENPFLLMSLVNHFILLSSSDAWNPMIVTMSSESKLLGIAPLMVKKAYGLKLARFILRPAYSPDFVISSENINTHGPIIIDYVLNHLGYHILSLDLKADSHCLEALRQRCKASGIHYSIVSGMGHRILPVKSTWQDFEKQKGGKFRRKFRKIQRNLDKIGTWKIICANRNEAYTEVLSKILEVEKESWKETWRSRKGSNIDEVLLAIWEGLKGTVQRRLDLDWAVWFLEMNGHPIAYTLVIFYGSVAYITKTSYNARYRRFYPGIYINHAAISQLWETKGVKRVDFLTDLQFMETWTDNVEGRIRMVVSKNPVLPLLFGPLLLNDYTKKALGPIMKGVLDRIPGLAGT